MQLVEIQRRQLYQNLGIKVTMGAFILAGILYGFGSWLEYVRG